MRRMLTAVAVGAAFAYWTPMSTAGDGPAETNFHGGIVNAARSWKRAVPAVPCFFKARDRIEHLGAP